MFRATGALAAAIVMGVTLGLPPAAATHVDTWRQFDSLSDGHYGINIKESLLRTKGAPGYVNVRVYGRDFVRRRLQGVDVFVDTRRPNSGPEFRVLYSPRRDGDTYYQLELRRVDSWRSDGRYVRCVRLSVSIDYRQDTVTARVPRACLNRPRAVRYNAMTWDFTRYSDAGTPTYGWYDATPVRHRMIPHWVQA